MSDPHYFTTMESRVGELTLVATTEGLRAVLWPDDEGRVYLPTDMTWSPDNEVLRATVEQLEEYFVGHRTTFDLPLDLRGTPFQVVVWRALLDIPYGSTATYTEHAERIGRPGAMRAVGSTNGRNPLSIVVPCHRVVGADGSLTGFAGGIATKRLLLELEGAMGDPRLPLSSRPGA